MLDKTDFIYLFFSLFMGGTVDTTRVAADIIRSRSC